MHDGNGSGEDDKDLPKPLFGLHKGKGIQRPGLYEFLGLALREQWGIVGDDDPDTVRAKAVWQIEQLVWREFHDDRVRLVLLTAFNLATPGCGTGETLEERWKSLEAHYAGGHDTRTAQRVFKEHAPDLRRALWRHPLPPPDSVTDDLDDEPPPDEPATNGTHRSPVLLAAMIRSKDRYSLNEIIEALLAEYLLVAVHPDGLFVIAHTASMGPWVCAFTDLDRLRRFQEVFHPSWSSDGVVPVQGRHLIRRMKECPLPLGLAIDPGPLSDDDDLPQTFPLDTLDLRRLATET